DSAKKAAERLAADCPQDVPAALSARLEAVEQGIDATLTAFDMIEPALQSFYGALDDEQKARLYRDMMAAPAATPAPEGTGRRGGGGARARARAPPRRGSEVFAPAPSRPRLCQRRAHAGRRTRDRRSRLEYDVRGACGGAARLAGAGDRARRAFELRAARC